MVASSLISNVIKPLKTTDTVQKALALMGEFKLCHLPVVNQATFVGLVTENELVEVRDTTTQIGNLKLTLLNPFVFEDAHIYDVIKIFNQLQLSVVPVLDSNNNYLGLIAINSILEFTAQLFALAEPGGILVLEIGNRDNSLAHMAQIVEANHAEILSSYVRSFPNSTKLAVTLKINKIELGEIIASFERYNYTVKAVYNGTKADNGTTHRFNSFMNYLNV